MTEVPDGHFRLTPEDLSQFVTGSFPHERLQQECAHVLDAYKSDLRQKVQERLHTAVLTWHDEDATPNEWKFARGATLALREVIAMIDGTPKYDET